MVGIIAPWNYPVANALMDAIGALAAQQRTALLCYERESGECHRSLIAARLQALGLVGEVEDLQPPRRGAR